MTWSIAAILGGAGIGVTAAGVVVWLALRLVAAQRALGAAQLNALVADGKRVLEVDRADRAEAERAAAVVAKDEAMRQASDRDAVIQELQSLLDECRDPVVVRARLADILSGRSRLPH